MAESVGVRLFGLSSTRTKTGGSRMKNFREPHLYRDKNFCNAAAALLKKLTGTIMGASNPVKGQCLDS